MASTLNLSCKLQHLKTSPFCYRAKISKNHNTCILNIYLLIQITDTTVTDLFLKMLPYCAIKQYNCILTPIIIIVLLCWHHTVFIAAEVTNLHSPESVQLIRQMEAAYCASRDDYDTCSDVEARICVNRKCVSACTINGMTRCQCVGCGLCCGNTRRACAGAAEHSIFDASGAAWARQSEIESCHEKDPRLLCKSGENGKICNILAESRAPIREVPYFCLQGECRRPHCQLLTDDGSSIECPCVGVYTRYPLCCMNSVNNSCLPFTFWLASGRSRELYAQAIAPSTVSNGSTTQTGRRLSGLWSACSTTTVNGVASTNDGKPCGYSHTCKGGLCSHICDGNPAKECFCLPGSQDECHICCLDDGGTCSSATRARDGAALNATTFHRTIGTSCNRTRGACSYDGTCTSRGAGNLFRTCTTDGETCGPQRLCTNGQCGHVCGTDTASCICKPSSGTECHVCCLDDRGQCTSIYDGVHVYLLRGVGQSCNYTFGTCTSTGACESVSSHPSVLCTVEGAPCGTNQVCKGGRCVHVCGSFAKQCICTPKSNTECHVCCMQGGVCGSIYDGSNQLLLRDPGQPCNYTFGACNDEGACKPVNTHPSFDRCFYEDNDGEQCGDRHICVDKKCQHVCRKTQLECECPPGSGKECHTCCLRDDICNSVYDARNGRSGVPAEAGWQQL